MSIVDAAYNMGGVPKQFPSDMNKHLEEGSLAKHRQVGGNHYKTLSVEPWEAMKSWLTREEFIGFLRGNIIKYQARANSGKGTREENLQKAGHYQQALEEFIKEKSDAQVNTKS